MFYPEDDEGAERAKRVCAGCQVQASCLDHALSFREKRMLERAKFLLVTEIAEAESKPRGAVEEKVDKALEKPFGVLSSRPTQKPVAPRRTANA